MKLKVFCVYDSKVEQYMNPFVQRSKGEALRSWQDTVNDRETQFNRHPEDFTLFEIGEWDSDSGLMTMYEAKASLGLALDFIKPTEVNKVSKIG